MQCPKCGIENPPEAMRCDCGYDFASGEMRESFLQPQSVSLRNVDRLAGWLLLPALGLILGIAVAAFETAVLVTPVVAAPSLEALLVLAFSMGWLAFAVVLAAFFFRRHRLAPRLYIAFLAGYVGLSALYLLAHAMGGGTETADAPREFMRSIIGAAIWIPYFLQSERVRMTFTRTWGR